MMAIQYDNKFTLGNIITIGTMIAGLAIGYANIQAQQVSDARRLEDLETRVQDAIDTQLSHEREFEARLRSVEVAQASQSSDLRNLLIGVNEIKVSLDRLTREPRP